MKFFKQEWNNIQDKCSCCIYEVDGEVSPYNLIDDWLFSNDTQENFSDNPDCIYKTTAEKAKIRQERLNTFLPHLEKEYPHFLKIAKKQNFISNLIKFNDILAIIIFLTLSYLATKFFVFLAPFITNIVMDMIGTYNWTIDNIINAICLLLIPFSYFIAWRIGDRFPYILTYPSILFLRNSDFRQHVRLNKDSHLRTFFKSTPYTIAFLIGNGFINSRDFCTPYDTPFYWRGHYSFVIPYKEIKKLNLNEFINYIKLRVEPTFKTYHRIERYVDSPKYEETKSLHALFFYLNEEDLKNTSKLRSKTLKSAPFARDIEVYKEPDVPVRDNYGKIILQRKSRDTKKSNDSDIYNRPQYQYNNGNVSQNSSSKSKKPSSYDRALSEWKEQIFISALLKNKKD